MGSIDKIRYVLIAVVLIFVGQSVAQGGARVIFDSGTIEIQAGEETLLCYRYGDVAFKPYIQKLFVPGGDNILLDSPDDHVHHHALMFAIGIDGIDYWGEQAGAGKQEVASVGQVKIGSNELMETAGFSQEINWTNPKGGETVVSEVRTIEAGQSADRGVTVVTWRSVLKVAPGGDEVVFYGDHYFGLGMRFVRSMDVGGEFFNADRIEGKIFRGSERLLRSRWCAYTAKVDGKLVTVAMFDAPKNTRHPAMWFTMETPFAYLSATLGFHEKTLKLAPGEQLDLSYGVAVWGGKVSAEKIEEVYGKWKAGR